MKNSTQAASLKTTRVMVEHRDIRSGVPSYQCLMVYYSSIPTLYTLKACFLNFYMLPYQRVLFLHFDAIPSHASLLIAALIPLSLLMEPECLQKLPRSMDSRMLLITI